MKYYTFRLENETAPSVRAENYTEAVSYLVNEGANNLTPEDFIGCDFEVDEV